VSLQGHLIKLPRVMFFAEMIEYTTNWSATEKTFLWHCLWSDHQHLSNGLLSWPEYSWCEAAKSFRFHSLKWGSGLPSESLIYL